MVHKIILFLFFSTTVFFYKNWRLQQDLNSDCRSIREPRWPLDHQLGPNIFLPHSFAGFSVCCIICGFNLKCWNACFCLSRRWLAQTILPRFNVFKGKKYLPLSTYFSGTVLHRLQILNVALQCLVLNNFKYFLMMKSYFRLFLTEQK